MRRVTPFMGAGLVALVVFADPTFTRLAWSDALAVLVAAGVIGAALAPIDWDRLPRLTIAAPVVLGLLLAMGATFTHGSTVSLAAAAAGVFVIVGIYGVRWDGLPRLVHQLPVFGGLAAVFVILHHVEATHLADASTRSIPIMILTAKDLTDGDKRQLSGHANAILARGSTGATDILAWLDRLMATRPVTSDPR